MSENMDDLFNGASAGSGGGAPSYAFPKELGRNNKVVPVIGSTIAGEIEGLFRTVVKDIDTGDPKLDKNGNEQPQVNITLKTSLRNWDSTIKPGKDEEGNELPPESDEGLRRVYAKHRMLQAIAKAVKESGNTGAPKVGGKLAIKVTNLIWDEKNTARNPLPDYEARYVAPDPGAAGMNDAFDGAAAQQEQAAPAAPAAPSTWDQEPPF